MNLREEKKFLKKIISIIVVFFIIIAFSVSGYTHQQDINDSAYVIAIRH